MRIALLANINLDILERQLSREADVYTPPGYAAWAREILALDSGLYRFHPDVIFIILDGVELLANKENLAEQMAELEINGNIIEQTVKTHQEFIFFVSTIDIPHHQLKTLDELREEQKIENTWHEILARLKTYGNFYIFDLKRLIEENGRSVFYSAKNWYLGGMKYSMQALGLLREEIRFILNAYAGNRKKCLALDLDNTLWGGVIGEDGLEGIELSASKEGARFKVFQQRIKEIKQRGVILAIVSKNNWQDAKEVFDNHPHMVLKPEDFVALKINWKPKYQNIREIAEELNIGLDSLVFIDDSPLERESIKHQLPAVEVPDFPRDTAHLESFITGIYREYFLTLRCTTEDQKKTRMYRQQIKMQQEMAQAPSLESFLKSLDIRVRIWRVTEEDIHRVSQLTQKTNQFNLTTRRYSKKEIRQLAQSPDHDVYVVSQADKFGDNGKVAVAIVKKTDAQQAQLDTFLMSCRVMGKSIEYQIIDYIENQLLSSGVQEFHTYYYPTAKNQPAADFFHRCGYELIGTNGEGGKQYRLKLMERPLRQFWGKLIELS